MIQVTVAEAHNRLSRWLKKIKEGPITITRRGKPVGVIIDPDEYKRLRQVQGYLQMTRLARTLADRDLTAAALFDASREELEDRP